MVLKRLLARLVTLCTVSPSRKAKVTVEPLETVRLFGENAMSFNVTVLVAAPATPVVHRAAERASPNSGKMMRLLMSLLGWSSPLSARRSLKRITGQGQRRAWNGALAPNPGCVGPV